MLQLLQILRLISKVVLFLVNIVLLFLIAKRILKNPLEGLIIMPVVTYVIPESYGILRFSFLSPGFFIAALTSLSILYNIPLVVIIKRMNIIFKIVMIMYVLNLIRSISDDKFSNFLTFIQGPVPFLLFSLIVDNYKDALKVITYWTTCYGYFCLVYLIRIYWNSEASSILIGLSGARNMDAWIDNAHNENLIAWVALLYIPLSLMILSNQKTMLAKLFFGSATLSIFILMIFGQSRAGLAGLALTVLLIIIFHIKENGLKNSINYIIILILGSIGMILFLIWIFNQGLLGHSSSIFQDLFIQEVYYRFLNIFVSIEESFDQISWFGSHNINYSGTHSTFGKTLIEYGIFYFFCQLFIVTYSLVNIYFLYNKKIITEVFQFISKIFIAFIVSIPIMTFGIAFHAIEYSQVYLLFVGFNTLIINIIKKERINLRMESIKY